MNALGRARTTSPPSVRLRTDTAPPEVPVRWSSAAVRTAPVETVALSKTLRLNGVTAAEKYVSLIAPSLRGGRGGPPAAGPVAFTVQVSADGATWGAPLAQGTGQTPTTVIAFAPVSAKFIRITQTGTASNGEVWAIQGVRVYRVGQ